RARSPQGADSDADGVPTMTHPAAGASTAPSRYEDMPFSLVLFRYLWPFWLFQDAGNGDRFARAAAYRHNRDMRVYLPGYLMKWMCSSMFALLMTKMLGSQASHRAGSPDLYSI